MRLSELEAVVESLLFIAGDAVSLASIAQTIELDQATTRAVVLSLADKYEKEKRGLRIVEIADAYQMCTAAECFEYIRNMYKSPQRQGLTQSLLETLAIIAYKQPVTRGDIEDIRGVTVNSNIMKQLQDRDWIECVGHRDTPGRPSLWATTAKFLEDFSLESLRALPVIPESTEVQPRLPGFEDLSKNGAGSGSDIKPDPEPVQEPVPNEPDEPLETEEQKNDES